MESLELTQEIASLERHLSHRAVTDEGGPLFGPENLAAADSSLFHSAPDLNPSWTIMARAPQRFANGRRKMMMARRACVRAFICDVILALHSRW